MTEVSTTEVTIYTDGACLNNPGPAGAGFVITDQKGILLKEGCLPIGPGTNNIAEYTALIRALRKATELGLHVAEVNPIASAAYGFTAHAILSYNRYDTPAGRKVNPKDTTELPAGTAPGTYDPVGMYSITIN